MLFLSHQNTKTMGLLLFENYSIVCYTLKIVAGCSQCVNVRMYLFVWMNVNVLVFILLLLLL